MCSLQIQRKAHSPASKEESGLIEVAWLSISCTDPAVDCAMWDPAVDCAVWDPAVDCAVWDGAAGCAGGDGAASVLELALKFQSGRRGGAAAGRQLRYGGLSQADVTGVLYA